MEENCERDGSWSIVGGWQKAKMAGEHEPIRVDNLGGDGHGAGGDRGERGRERAALLAVRGRGVRGGGGDGGGVATDAIFRRGDLPGEAGAGGRKRVALTFDDGPDPAATPRLLELLAREGIQAAFFCVGRKVAEQPELAARLAAAGHVLGNHTYHHRWWSNFMRRAAWRREIERTQEAIEAAAGVSAGLDEAADGVDEPGTCGRGAGGGAENGGMGCAVAGHGLFGGDGFAADPAAGRAMGASSFYMMAGRTRRN